MPQINWLSFSLYRLAGVSKSLPIYSDFFCLKHYSLLGFDENKMLSIKWLCHNSTSQCATHGKAGANLFLFPARRAVIIPANKI